MVDRRTGILDAAIARIGEHGMRGLTHRAVDAAAGLPAGSTSNYFRTKDALLAAVVERFTVRERSNWEEMATTSWPRTPADLAATLARFARDSTGAQRSLTLARYAILVEGAQRPGLQAELAAGGARVTAWFTQWVRAVASPDPERDTAILANYVAGLVLHELASPSGAFDPAPELTVLIEALVATPQHRRSPEPEEAP